MKRVKSANDEGFGPLPVPEVEYEPITRSFLAKQLILLEKLIVLNSDQRKDNPKNPEKFLKSESELNDLLSWFIGIGTSDSDVLLSLIDDKFESFYTNLVPLIEHANTDIGNRVIEIIHEIIHDEEGFKDQEDLEIISEISYKLIKSDLISMFTFHIKTLKKNNEDDPDDFQAVYQIFEIIEDILNNFHQNGRDELRLNEFYSSLTRSKFLSLLTEMFSQDPKLVRTESMGQFSSSGEYANRLYAAELCATILQLSAIDSKSLLSSVNELWASSIDVIIESLLISISPYRSRDPIDADEQEYLFNLFDSLAALLLNSIEARKVFSSEKCEGFQLFLLFLKEVNISRLRAIQIIDYVLAPEETSDLAKTFINLGGLKVISPILMGKGTLKLIKNYPKLLLSIDTDEGHVCAIIASLFKNLPSNSSEYFRLIAKFVENSGEKFFKLLDLHKKYSEKLFLFDREHGITNKRSIENEDWLLDRINAGLFSLQQIDICLLVLLNSLKILQLIGNNPDSQIEIEKELFDKVWDESEKIFKIEEIEIVKEIRENVNEFINELDNKNTILLIPLLKTFQ